MTIQEIERKARQLREMLSLIDEAQAEAEALKDEIKAAMGDAQELRAGEYKITWKAVKSSRVDSKRLKVELPDVARRYMVETEYRRFCVL